MDVRTAGEQFLQDGPRLRPGDGVSETAGWSGTEGQTGHHNSFVAGIGPMIDFRCQHWDNFRFECPVTDVVPLRVSGDERHGVLTDGM
ncbi:hypothetical protein [Streptomyces sp. BV129]|uniref:hypothetical protein n=1 Tax=Streptomyces sp. BV129 TaxID=2849671 RepID=UPI001C2E1ACE|nr:hypothetical protein [Streptomyces sp. BV129]MBV1949050.1 hypothetical protein [Streptomyces sp. BV129]